MRKALILFGFIQITFWTACLSQSFNDTTAYEKRLALHALRRLYANAEVADTLYCAYMDCMEYKSYSENALFNYQLLDAENTKVNQTLSREIKKLKQKNRIKNYALISSFAVIAALIIIVL